MKLLTVTKLSKSFGGNRAVDEVSFQLAAGELLALIGPNGAGKSTTFNMVNGQLAADSGSIRLDGEELIGTSRATSGSAVSAALSRSPRPSLR